MHAGFVEVICTARDTGMDSTKYTIMYIKTRLIVIQ